MGFTETLPTKQLREIKERNRHLAGGRALLWEIKRLRAVLYADQLQCMFILHNLLFWGLSLSTLAANGLAFSVPAWRQVAPRS